MPVFVDGLPDGWAARVSAAGTIVFEHLATGYEQSTIPPGFQAAASSDERADEPAMAAEAEDETAQELRRHKSATEQAVAQLVCPITRSLPFDPVIAEDGKVYERSAIEEWLKQQGKSPLTNLPMGTKLLPAMHVKNMIRVMVTSGTLTGDHAEAEDETAQELRRHKSATEQAVAELFCPITYSLPFDPVIVEDGKVYERSAIEEWLKQKGRSPLTNLPMGTKLLPAMHVKNMIRVMVTSGTLTDGHKQVALVLLEAGASLKVVSIDNFTMLMAASFGGLTTVLERVLPQSDIDAALVASHATEAGYTALMYAAKAGQQHCVHMLLSAGARKEVQTATGKTAFSLAHDSGHTAICDLLAQ
ncbi:ubox-containing protein [Chrysochromulina tobinii]|uniref:Ubox-containing protein n=1 Tax=Chrysochromulina tobinii TaxID=1460289 RepID=A0A0M0JSI8_9EUKA|nr:ubox-containing protein [Chrysochromulina tobinii]|eukprot:KOO29539.1 ubox-containing protein [Chrysochromulina sp. CCMP291]